MWGESASHIIQMKNCHDSTTQLANKSAIGQGNEPWYPVSLRWDTDAYMLHPDLGRIYKWGKLPAFRHTHPTMLGSREILWEISPVYVSESTGGVGRTPICQGKFPAENSPGICICTLTQDAYLQPGVGGLLWDFPPLCLQKCAGYIPCRRFPCFPMWGACHPESLLGSLEMGLGKWTSLLLERCPKIPSLQGSRESQVGTPGAWGTLNLPEHLPEEAREFTTANKLRLLYSPTTELVDHPCKAAAESITTFGLSVDFSWCGTTNGRNIY